MKTGSLVERNKNLTLIDLKTGICVEGYPGKIPKGVPLVISGWVYGDKHTPELFYFSIEGYEFTKNPDGSLMTEFYSPSLFIELQPPMDMTFIEEMQSPNNIREKVLVK